MHRVYIVRQLVFTAAMVVAFAIGATAESINERLERDFEPQLADLMEENSIPGVAIAVVAEGQAAYLKGFGVANVDTKASITPRSLFHLASVTKTFVATSVMQLVEAGKVELDAPIIRYVPYFREQGDYYKDITVRHLLTHTAGMGDVINYEWNKPQFDDGALERFIRSLAEREPIAAPGVQREYSNIGYELLGDMIAKVSGETFEAYVQEHILAPLAMNDSTLLHADANAELMTAPHVRKASAQAAVWEFFPYNRRHAPSSTMHSNAADMTRYMLAHLNHGELEGKRILAVSTYDLWWKPYTAEDTGMGLCWFLRDFEGHRAAEHGGADTGYKSHLVLFPDDGIGLFMAANHNNAPIQKIANAALHVIFADETR